MKKQIIKQLVITVLVLATYFLIFWKSGNANLAAIITTLAAGITVGIAVGIRVEKSFLVGFAAGFAVSGFAISLIAATKEWISLGVAIGAASIVVATFPEKPKFGKFECLKTVFLAIVQMLAVSLLIDYTLPS